MPAEKRELLTKYGADVVDMEGAAVAQVAQERGLEFAAVKAISDEAGFRYAAAEAVHRRQWKICHGRFVHLCRVAAEVVAGVGKIRANTAIASANLCRAVEHLIEDYASSPSSAERAPGAEAQGNFECQLRHNLAALSGSRAIPSTMTAAVYRGVNDVRLETVPVPQIGAGEILVRVHTCGICGTDLKKIATGSHSAPRIFGHETTGVVAAVGEDVTEFRIGDRVMVFHHIPCGECYYCQHKVFAQCPTYKKVGATAGYEPSGGGFAEYVRVMEWIVRKGVIRIPDGVSFEQASFIEPVNTCMKGIETLGLKPGETVLVIGQGPIGIILAVLARRCGVTGNYFRFVSAEAYNS